MTKPITPTQRKVLKVGRAFGYAHAVGMCPPCAWVLKEQTRVTSTVDALLKSGLMKREDAGGRRIAQITPDGRTALTSS